MSSPVLPKLSSHVSTASLSLDLLLVLSAMSSLVLFAVSSLVLLAELSLFFLQCCC